MSVEQWKRVVDYEDIYDISTYGNIKSKERINYMGYHFKERMLKYAVDRNGYARVYLTKYGKTKSKLVHRLVAQAFIPNPDNLPEVNHIDENKLNNNVENLEWCTHKYNSNYGTRVSRIIPKTIDKTRKPVNQYDLQGIFIKTWYSINDASRTLDIIQQNISKCCKGERQKAGGYIWKYAKEGDK